MSTLKEGHIVPLKNVNFEMGEYADGDLGMLASFQGNQVRLKFTPRQLETMMRSAANNPEDFEALPTEQEQKECGLGAFIGNILSSILSRR